MRKIMLFVTAGGLLVPAGRTIAQNPPPPCPEQRNYLEDNYFPWLRDWHHFGETGEEYLIPGDWEFLGHDYVSSGSWHQGTVDGSLSWDHDTDCGE